MRSIQVLSLAAAALVLGVAGAAAEEALPPVDWLFIQEAEAATYADGELTLTGVAPEVIAFTDRPHRISTRLDLPAFAGLWSAGKDSFGEDKPNAGITLMTPDGPKTAVIELDLPHIEGETLVYDIRVIGGVLPQEGQDVSLFIDAFPTSVNDQVTDAVTLVNTKVLGEAPAMAMGNLYQATAQALSNAAHNATTSQQQTNVTAQSSTDQGVATLYSVDTAATGASTSDILTSSFGDSK